MAIISFLIGIICLFVGALGPGLAFIAIAILIGSLS